MNVLGAFRVKRGGIERRFTPAERRMIENLTNGLRETLGSLGTVDSLTDPVLGRLLPDAYPGDHDAQAEFAAATRERLAESKGELAERLAADLAAAPNGLLRLDAAGADAWLRGLGDLRLALAERVGIDEVQRDVRSPQGMLYAWLTWLQGSLVDAVEKL